ncbi:hypothetical protein [Streptomyces chartreusis]
MPAGSSAEGERQYEHISKSAQDEGGSAERANVLYAEEGRSIWGRSSMTKQQPHNGLGR